MWIVQSHLHFHLFQRYGQDQKEKVRLCKLWIKTRKDCRHVPFWKHKSIKNLFFLSWCVKDVLGTFHLRLDESSIKFHFFWQSEIVWGVFDTIDDFASITNLPILIAEYESVKWISWIPHYLFRILRLNPYIKSRKHIYVQYSKVFHYSASWMWCLSGQETFNSSFNNTSSCTTNIFLKSTFFFLNKAEVWQPSLNYSTPPLHLKPLCFSWVKKNSIT